MDSITKYELAPFTALLNMIKVNYFEKPEVFKSLLAILVDYNPENKEQIEHYVKTLLADHSDLAECLITFLPDARVAEDDTTYPVPDPQLIVSHIKRQLGNVSNKDTSSITNVDKTHLNELVGSSIKNCSKEGMHSRPLKDKVTNKFRAKHVPFHHVHRPPFCKRRRRRKRQMPLLSPNLDHCETADKQSNDVNPSVENSCTSVTSSEAMQTGVSPTKNSQPQKLTGDSDEAQGSTVKPLVKPAHLEAHEEKMECDLKLSQKEEHQDLDDMKQMVVHHQDSVCPTDFEVDLSKDHSIKDPTQLTPVSISQSMKDPPQHTPVSTSQSIKDPPQHTPVSTSQSIKDPPQHTPVSTSQSIKDPPQHTPVSTSQSIKDPPQHTPVSTSKSIKNPPQHTPVSTLSSLCIKSTASVSFTHTLPSTEGAQSILTTPSTVSTATMSASSTETVEVPPDTSHPKQQRTQELALNESTIVENKTPATDLSIQHTKIGKISRLKPPNNASKRVFSLKNAEGSNRLPLLLYSGTKSVKEELLGITSEKTDNVSDKMKRSTKPSLVKELLPSYEANASTTYSMSHANNMKQLPHRMITQQNTLLPSKPVFSNRVIDPSQFQTAAVKMGLQPCFPLSYANVQETWSHNIFQHTSECTSASVVPVCTVMPSLGEPRPSTDNQSLTGATGLTRTGETISSQVSDRLNLSTNINNNFSNNTLNNSNIIQQINMNIPLHKTNIPPSQFILNQHLPTAIPTPDISQFVKEAYSVPNVGCLVPYGSEMIHKNNLFPLIRESRFLPIYNNHGNMCPSGDNKVQNPVLELKDPVMDILPLPPGPINNTPSSVMFPNMFLPDNRTNTQWPPRQNHLNMQPVTIGCPVPVHPQNNPQQQVYLGTASNLSAFPYTRQMILPDGQTQNVFLKRSSVPMSDTGMKNNLSSSQLHSTPSVSRPDVPNSMSTIVGLTQDQCQITPCGPLIDLNTRILASSETKFDSPSNRVCPGGYANQSVVTKTFPSTVNVNNSTTLTSFANDKQITFTSSNQLKQSINTTTMTSTNFKPFQINAVSNTLNPFNNLTPGTPVTSDNVQGGFRDRCLVNCSQSNLPFLIESQPQQSKSGSGRSVKPRKLSMTSNIGVRKKLRLTPKKD